MDFHHVYHFLRAYVNPIKMNIFRFLPIVTDTGLKLENMAGEKFSEDNKIRKHIRNIFHFIFLFIYSFFKFTQYESKSS